jgi:hypothetical protein
LSIVATFTIFHGAFGTIKIAFNELWQSVIAYFMFLFTLQLPTKSPIQSPTGKTADAVLPDTAAGFNEKTSTFWEQLFNGDNFVNYLSAANTALTFLLRILPFVIMLLFSLRVLIRRAFETQNNDYNKDTKPLRVYKKISSTVYTPIKNYIVSCMVYIRRTPFPKLWLAIWLFNFNIFAALLSTLGITFYFFISFDLVAVYYFIYGVITKLQPAFHFIPLWCWVILALYLVDRWRKNIAVMHLRYMERLNTTFILNRSICSMFVGTMGKGKTTLITDISLSTEAIFRNKAHDMMLDIDCKFPYFPYIILENELKAEMEAGRVFNLAGCGEWIESKRKLFYKVLRQIHKRKLHDNTAFRLVWDYDFVTYGLEYDDKKTVTNIFDALRDYAKLYLIYITQSSLIISNYAIRTDFIKQDTGNFPFWNMDFFTRDSRYIEETSRHSHILDFDMLRLGKKLIENNKLSNAFEFGVIAITETGKERGNQYKLQEIKETLRKLRNTTDTEQATQLTDKFNDSLKLIRHKCTVAGFPFARVFLDEQRPESLGADARNLCEIVHIESKSEMKLTMPFYFIGELLHSWLFGKFAGCYRQYRFNRGDNTLLMYLIKKVGAYNHNSYTRIYNRFGYTKVILEVEDGATGQLLKTDNYFLSTKKIYSNRFATDTYGDIFASGLKGVNVGLDTLPEYKTHKASEDELQLQNSYFVTDVLKYGRPQE